MQKKLYTEKFMLLNLSFMIDQEIITLKIKIKKKYKKI